jgi:hypothetical protein
MLLCRNGGRQMLVSAGQVQEVSASFRSVPAATYLYCSVKLLRQLLVDPASHASLQHGAPKPVNLSSHQMLYAMHRFF